MDILQNKLLNSINEYLYENNEISKIEYDKMKSYIRSLETKRHVC